MIKTRKAIDKSKEVVLEFATYILGRQINSNISKEQLEYIYHSFITYRKEKKDEA